MVRGGPPGRVDFDFDEIDADLAQREFTLDQWITQCHGDSKAAGWWRPGDDQNMNCMATKIALIHSEVSELLEGLRKGLPDDHLPHRRMEDVEAADVFIRLMDYCGARDIDLLSAVIEKIAYNRTRADHSRAHRAGEGGKKF